MNRHERRALAKQLGPTEAAFAKGLTEVEPMARRVHECARELSLCLQSGIIDGAGKAFKAVCSAHVLLGKKLLELGSESGQLDAKRE
jgi:hypothetical protein